MIFLLVETGKSVIVWNSKIDWQSFKEKGKETEFPRFSEDDWLIYLETLEKTQQNIGLMVEIGKVSTSYNIVSWCAKMRRKEAKMGMLSEDNQRVYLEGQGRTW